MIKERTDAWHTIVFQCTRSTMTQLGLRNIRIAGEHLGLSVEDMEDIEAAIGYRREDNWKLFTRWESVRKFKAIPARKSA